MHADDSWRTPVRAGPRARAAAGAIRHRSAQAGFLVLLLAVITGCGSPPPAAPSGAKGPAALAAEALEAGEYSKAAALYREALRQTPQSVPLHYGLGVAASFLQLRDEAIREFSWVVDQVAHGAAGATEAAEARRWLISAGVLQPRPSIVTGSPSREERKADGASLEGNAIGAADGQSPKPMPLLQLFLRGRPNTPSRAERYYVRTDQSGHFAFDNVAPGVYKLTNRVAGKPLWRLRVEVKPGEHATLDLSPANGIAQRDDFPAED